MCDRDDRVTDVAPMRNARPFFHSYLVSIRRRPLSVTVLMQLNFNKVSVPTNIYPIFLLIDLTPSRKRMKIIIA